MMEVGEKDCVVIGSPAKAQNAGNAAHWRGFTTQAGGVRTSKHFANHCLSGIKACCCGGERAKQQQA
jgi:hypothetical protein